MDLQDLLERVERATGPDRELGVTVLSTLLSPTPVTVSKSPFNGAWCAYETDRNGRERLWQTPMPFRQMGCVTESVDAALALIGRVLPEWWWTVGQSAPTGFASATVARKGGTVRSVSAPTPALALCAALLAAMIERENTNG